MKSSISKISLAVATGLFFSGFFILCDCPGWYALAVLFAAVAVWLGTAGIRTWGIVCLVASGIMTGFHTCSMFQDHNHRVEKIRRNDTGVATNLPSAGRDAFHPRP